MANQFKLVGYEHRFGTKRSTGAPYDIEIFHLQNLGDISLEIGFGNRVETIVYNRLVADELDYIPSLGDVVVPCYNRSGYFTGFIPV